MNKEKHQCAPGTEPLHASISSPLELKSKGYDHHVFGTWLFSVTLYYGHDDNNKNRLS